MIDEDRGLPTLPGAARASAQPVPMTVPHCATDGMRLMATIVGWRCPLCGVLGAPGRAA